VHTAPSAPMKARCDRDSGDLKAPTLRKLRTAYSTHNHSGDLLITLSRVGSFRAGRHGALMCKLWIALAALIVLRRGLSGQFLLCHGIPAHGGRGRAGGANTAAGRSVAGFGFCTHAESAAFGGDTKLVRIALASLCFEDSKARLARSTSDRGIFTLRFALRCRSRRFLDIRSRT
jgi:hypothetical protein